MKHLFSLALIPLLSSCSSISVSPSPSSSTNTSTNSPWKLVNEYDWLGRVLDDKVPGTDFVESFSKNTDVKARITNLCDSRMYVRFDKKTNLSDKDSIKYEYIDRDKRITVTFFNKGKRGGTGRYHSNIYDDDRGLYLTLYDFNNRITLARKDERSFLELEDDQSFSNIKSFIETFDFISIAIPWPKVKIVDYVWSLDGAIETIDEYCTILKNKSPE